MWEGGTEVSVGESDQNMDVEVSWDFEKGVEIKNQWDRFWRRRDRRREVKI